MATIVIEKTKDTPSVLFDAEKGVLELKGLSLPENVIKFYQSLIDAVNEYVKAPKDKTVIRIMLEYYNTATSKLLASLLIKFEDVVKAQKEVVIEWYFAKNDEIMQEKGEELQSIIQVPFKLIPQQ
ncbi:MAG: DUF1987 domain-containing protein [Bacteroidetes bacterium]|nr:DUF1987 domain-containing protein [Bacteroidota bacterium]